MCSSDLHLSDWFPDNARIGVVLVDDEPYTQRQVGEALSLDVVGVVARLAERAASDPFARSGKRRDGWVSALDELLERLSNRPTPAVMSLPDPDPSTATEFPLPVSVGRALGDQ